MVERVDDWFVFVVAVRGLAVVDEFEFWPTTKGASNSRQQMMGIPVLYMMFLTFRAC